MHSPAATYVLIACVLIAGWLVFVPLAALFYTAFTEDTGFGPGPASLQNFVEAYSSWHIVATVRNSLVFAAGTAVITLIMGGLVAFVVERTDAPGGPLFHRWRCCRSRSRASSPRWPGFSCSARTSAGSMRC